ncbi:MAG: hypothetical protein RL322_2825 [Pseudomonadota bacterium]
MMELEARKIIRFEQAKGRTFDTTLNAERTQQCARERRFARTQPAGQVEPEPGGQRVGKVGRQGLGRRFTLENAVEVLKSHVGGFHHDGGSS